MTTITMKQAEEYAQNRVTLYIVCTAHEFCMQQNGEEFARMMLNDAGISMNNVRDAKLIDSLGPEYVETVRRLT